MNCRLRWRPSYPFRLVLEASVPLAGRTILVAEDNPTNRLVLQKVLANAGHEVTLVDNGEQALDELERRRFDCVIVDWHMPAMGDWKR